jgi:hypothetical protein
VFERGKRDMKKRALETGRKGEERERAIERKRIIEKNEKGREKRILDKEREC